MTWLQIFIYIGIALYLLNALMVGTDIFLVNKYRRMRERGILK